MTTKLESDAYDCWVRAGRPACGKYNEVTFQRLLDLDERWGKDVSAAFLPLRTSLPSDPNVRKATPIATGVLDYFPDALAAVADCSRVGNDQHNPGQPLHWAKEKSTDHADCIVRHLIDRGKRDGDGVRHSAKVAWRALALLQTELEKEAQDDPFYDPRTGRRAGDPGPQSS